MLTQTIPTYPTAMPSCYVPIIVHGVFTSDECEPGDMRIEMVEDEFDKYFARAALGRSVNDGDEEEGRRGSLPSATSATLKVAEPSGCRRAHSCKLPGGRRKRSISPRPNGTSQRRTSSLLIDSTNGGDGGTGSDDSGKNLLNDNYIHETTLRAPSPGLKCHSAPHSRSSSWKKNRRPHGGSIHGDPDDNRPRTGSVPLEEKVITKLEQLKMLQADELCPVRTFSLSSKGLINRGDSFKRKSEQSVISEGGASSGTTNKSQHTHETVEEIVQSIESPSVISQPKSKLSAPQKPQYKVLILGDHGVGKTALLNQFMTSDYMGASDTSFDNEGEITVSVDLDGEETTMDFIDVPTDEEKLAIEAKPDAYVVVYSITDRSSYQHGIELLNHIQSQTDATSAAIILVANKSELVRSRQVSDNEVREVCEARDCKCIEVSAVLNHKVDELLVGVASQIRLNPQRVEKKKLEQKPRELSCVTSAKGLLGKLFRRTQYVSKSCDNLMVL